MTFTFKLEHEDGTLADPRTLTTAVPDWRSGDTIPRWAAGCFACLPFATTTPIKPPYWLSKTVAEERLATRRGES